MEVNKKPFQHSPSLCTGLKALGNFSCAVFRGRNWQRAQICMEFAEGWYSSVLTPHETKRLLLCDFATFVYTQPEVELNTAADRVDGPCRVS